MRRSHLDYASSTSPCAGTGAAGFTALELVVAIALVALLAGLVGQYRLQDPARARVRRAEAETQTLAHALRLFAASVGQWPTLDANGRTDRLRLLLSGPTMPTGNPWAAAHAFWSWTAGGFADLLQDHLLRNRPANQTARRYPQSGVLAWRGPYVEISPLDPWGRPYVANVIATHSSDPTNHRRLFVLSAGPDGRFQTGALATAQQAVAGDDIGCLAWER